MEYLLPLAGIIAAMLVIWRACDGFEAASEYLGRNLSDGVRGGTINAIGSSLPELLTTMFGLLVLNNADGFSFGIGTTAGSAIFNSAVIPGLVILCVTLGGLATAVTVSKKVVWRDGIALLGAEFLLIFLLAKGSLGWIDGLVMIGYYVGYLYYMINTMSKDESESDEDEDEDDDEAPENKSLMKSILTLDLESVVLRGQEINDKSAYALISLATLVIGAACYLLVESCHTLGTNMGILPYFVAVLLAAAATSVPDTMLSIKDAKKGDYDDAVANALGSNIFDICVALGLPLFIFCAFMGGTVTIGGANADSVAELRVLLLLMTSIIFALFAIGDKMGKAKAWIMMFSYAGFVGYVIARAYEVPFAVEIGKYFQSFLKLLEGLWL